MIFLVDFLLFKVGFRWYILHLSGVVSASYSKEWFDCQKQSNKKGGGMTKIWQRETWNPDLVGILAVLSVVLSTAVLASVVGGGEARACSDIFISAGPPKVSARNLDWPTDDLTLITVNPRGTFRRSTPYNPDDHAAEWLSQYGTVTFRMHSFGIYIAIDGMNEHGLSGALLGMEETQYPDTDTRPFLNDDMWMLYFLDNCRTVAEAAALAPTVRGGGRVPQHLILHDPSGDSAVLEYVNKELQIYRPPEYNGVTTNEPPYPEQIANLENYQGFGGDLPLPGDIASDSRFVRASWYLQTLPEPETAEDAFAGARAIIGNISKPLVPGASHTAWTVFRDHLALKYYWRSFYLPDSRYVDMNTLDFSVGNPVTVLDLYADLTGDTAGYFKPDSSQLRLVSGDYNGDGTADIALFRARTGLWAIRGISRAYFGGPGDLPVPGDYNGDGTTGIGIFRGSTGLWSIRGVTRYYFGDTASRPVPGDYDGDGSCDIGIFKGASGLWALQGISRVYFGSGGDAPAPGDYNGDNTTDIGIFRATVKLWAVRGVSRCYFGTVFDTPSPGDYNGDGTWEPAAFSITSIFSLDGVWNIKGITRKSFGLTTDLPVPADYDGNGTTAIGIFRPSSGLWALDGCTRTYYGTYWDLPATR
jgi:penicillin V acylase-like amidase (Ntn superfamily)